MKLFETINLCKEFQRRTATGSAGVPAVHEVNLTVDEGEFITITGVSGSGKTTLLTLLAGLASPTGGEVLFRGRALTALPDRELSRIRNRDIGFVPQGTGLLGNLTIMDNVRAPQIFAGGNAADSSRAGFLLETVGLADLALEYPKNLSGGEMRRASIARALFNEPLVLLADEPTSDLDPENTGMVMNLLGEIHRQGTTVIVVTHELGVAACGTRRLRMAHGLLGPFRDEIAPLVLETATRNAE
jgi:ABC-type antimicrobial peptide transport system, ATPase component